jgi:hypothetical protein
VLFRTSVGEGSSLCTAPALKLGAGWAPWCVIAHLAAKQRGVANIKVIGVEGVPSRLIPAPRNPRHVPPALGGHRG